MDRLAYRVADVAALYGVSVKTLIAGTAGHRLQPGESGPVMPPDRLHALLVLRNLHYKVRLGLDIAYASVDTKYMKTNEQTTSQMIQAMKSMTVEERMALLRQTRPDLFEVKAPVVSFGKAPKDGWKESDRVAK